MAVEVNGRKVFFLLTPLRSVMGPIPLPDVLLGTPAHFIGRLLRHFRVIPVVLRGPRGGSALCAHPLELHAAGQTGKHFLYHGDSRHMFAVSGFGVLRAVLAFEKPQVGAPWVVGAVVPPLLLEIRFGL